MPQLDLLHFSISIYHSILLFSMIKTHEYIVYILSIIFVTFFTSKSSYIDSDSHFTKAFILSHIVSLGFTKRGSLQSLVVVK